MGNRVHLDHVDVARLHDHLAMDAELWHVDAWLVGLPGRVVNTRARMRAVVLLPTPRTRVRCGLMDTAAANELASVRTIGSWPTDPRSASAGVAPAPGTEQLAAPSVGQREEQIAERPPLSPVKSSMSERLGLAQGRLARGATPSPAPLAACTVGGWTRPACLVRALPSGPDPVGGRFVLGRAAVLCGDRGGRGCPAPAI